MARHSQSVELLFIIKWIRNLFKKKKSMKILTKNYVLSYEDNTFTVVDNDSEDTIISLSGSELSEFKRAIGYLEQEANA